MASCLSFLYSPLSDCGVFSWSAYDGATLIYTKSALNSDSCKNIYDIRQKYGLGTQMQIFKQQCSFLPLRSYYCATNLHLIYMPFYNVDTKTKSKAFTGTNLSVLTISALSSRYHFLFKYYNIIGIIFPIMLSQ